MNNCERKCIVHFGAGNIGRSLVGQVFSKAGYDVIFIDTVPEIIDELNSKERYKVKIKDTLPPGVSNELWVENVRGISAFNNEAVINAVAGADLISTAVGANILPRILPVIAKGILKRSASVSLLFCENLRGVSEIAKDEISKIMPEDFDIESRIGFVTTSIGKMVPLMPNEIREKDPLEVWGEAYNQILADKAGFVNEPPEIKGLVLKNNFSAYMDRKLFIHNLGHAASAYFGFLKNKTAIWECMADEQIREETKNVMQEAGKALIKHYPSEFNKKNIEEHIEDLLNRFANKMLGDTVFRVGRDLNRKLSSDDRCIGALRLIVNNGGNPEPVCRVIAAALCFKAKDESGNLFPADEEFYKELNSRGINFMLSDLCKLDAEKDSKEIKLIIKSYITQK